MNAARGPAAQSNLDTMHNYFQEKRAKEKRVAVSTPALIL